MAARCDFRCACVLLLLNCVSYNVVQANDVSSVRCEAVTAKILGCEIYKSNSQCAKCKAGYQLASGSCTCAAGYEQDGADCKPGPCHRQCGKTNIKSTEGSVCHCDYYCNDHDDCCGGSSSKDALCPHMAPTMNKKRLTDGRGTTNKQTRSVAAIREGNHKYMPGMCWCDEHCRAAGDCCASCSLSTSSSSSSSSSSDASRSIGNRVSASTATVSIASLPGSVAVADISLASPSSVTASSSDTVQVAPQLTSITAAATTTDDVAAGIATVTADASSALAQQVAAEAAAAAAKTGGRVDDCAAHRAIPGHVADKSHSTVSIASVNSDFAMVQAEMKMQQCQAADQGPPATPYIIPIHWTAGQVCRDGSCTGGQYSAAIVRKQITHVNNVYARVGIQFSWDGVIHTATAANVTDIDVCSDPAGRCWVCQQTRYGDQVAMNVVTSPTHVGGTALGVTLYPSYIASGQIPACANWVFIYEKTLPGLGGRSLVDGGLADGGGTLAHEIGHALMLRHTWYEAYETTHPPVQSQCKGSASMDPYDIMAGRSDGVRDTPAQSLNGSASLDQKTDILRFVKCDQQTGAYKNRTAFAQQSCTSEVGFPNGDKYYNNFGNLMSYGDKTCLRTLTPGQGARVRCGLKCIRQGSC